MWKAIPDPRYGPGTPVECLLDGEFCRGIVVGNHYREPDFEPGYYAPYQIQLDDDEPGDMIFINYDSDETIRVALPAPRFEVGARVECNIDDEGTFLKGTVVRHHYRERHWESGLCAPYQVQLDEGFQGLVSENDEGLIYASEDNDKSIRAAAPDSSDEPVAAPTTSDGDA